MKAEELWRWRVQGRDGSVVTAHHATEEAIRVDHPEAVRVEGTRIVMEVPDTVQETRDSWFGGLDSRFATGSFADDEPQDR